MKWYKKGDLLYANSAKTQGIVYIINLFKKQMYVYQGRKQVYFTDNSDEVNRFLFEFGYDYWS